MTRRAGFFDERDVKWRALVENLGGEDVLSMMIGAYDFSPLYYNDEGLQFFYTRGTDRVLHHRATFNPINVEHSLLSGSHSYNIGIRVHHAWDQLNDYTGIAYHPSELIKTFEKVSGLVVGFG